MESPPSSPRGEDDLQDISAQVEADALNPVEVYAPEKEVQVDNADMAKSNEDMAKNNADLAKSNADLANNNEELAENNADEPANNADEPDLDDDALEDDLGSEVVSPENSDDEMPVDEPAFVDLESNDFTSLYRETNLGMFVKALKESGLIGQSVRVLLTCKSKYVNINIARDIFGWSQNIKYKSEQYKTFVPTINVETINMLPADATQSVMDARPIFDGIKNKNNTDTTQFIQDQINEKVIVSSSVPYSNQFMEGTPMLDLVLQNPGSIFIVTENGNMDAAFDFLQCSIMKTSKKKKMVQGVKTSVKTFNLRDILYILSQAGANSVTVINATNGFTFEDDPLDEDDVLDEGKNMNEVESIFDDEADVSEKKEEPALEPAEEDSPTVEEPTGVEEAAGDVSEKEANAEGNNPEEAIDESDGEESATEGEASAADGEASAADGEASATEGEASAADGEAIAVDGEGTATEGEGSKGGKKTRKHKLHRQKQTRKNPKPL
jgi:hypothetical protein